MSARRRRRRLQRSRRSLGGRHWSVAGSGRLRGSPRYGAVPRRASRRLRASRPRLSGSMLGLGSWARNWSWGWGAWLPLLRFSGQASPFPPTPASLLFGGWVTPPARQASPGAPGCVLLLLLEPGASWEPGGFSELPGRGASLRATPGRSCAGGGGGGPAFLSLPVWESHLACPPVPVLAGWSRGAAPAVARGWCWSRGRSWLQRFLLQFQWPWTARSGVQNSTLNAVSSVLGPRCS